MGSETQIGVKAILQHLQIKQYLEPNANIILDGCCMGGKAPEGSCNIAEAFQIKAGFDKRIHAAADTIFPSSFNYEKRGANTNFKITFKTPEKPIFSSPFAYFNWVFGIPTRNHLNLRDVTVVYGGVRRRKILELETVP